MSNILDQIDQLLLKHENRARAIQMEAYMKNKFPFRGISAPQRTDLFRGLWAEYKKDIIADWKNIVNDLWDRKYREHQMIAMLILKKIQRKLVLSDLDFLIGLVQRKSWWDTVDFLASNSIGYVVYKNIQNQDDIVKKWIHHDNIWVQRVALIHQLKYKEKVNLKLLFYCVLQVKSSTEFFLRKGAGWGLREASKKYPEEILNFVNQHPDLSNLTKREATRLIKI